MGSNAKVYEKSDTSENAVALRAKYLGDLADTICSLVVESEYMEDEVAWLNYCGGKCDETGNEHFVQSQAHGGHHTCPKHPITGPFTCTICEAVVDVTKL